MKNNQSPHRLEMTPLRQAAQGCFFLAGLSTVVFFGGVELWAREIMLLLLGAACLLEGLSPCRWRLRMSKGMMLLGGGLIGIAALSLCPWPVAWAEWLAPGQARLLKEMEVRLPSRLHGSMDPSATWQSLAMLMAFGSAIYLAWYWSMDHYFRRRLRNFILLLGVLTALLGVLDYSCNSDRIYGLRHTEFAHHWGPFINRNHFANYLVICGIFSLAMFYRYSFPLELVQRNHLNGIVALGICMLCIGCAVMTTSRGAMVALGAGLLVFALLLWYGAKSLSRVRGLLIVIVVGAALVLTYGRNLLQRVESAIGRESALTEEGRLYLWNDVWKMGGAMRGRGVGAGAFETVFPAFQTFSGHKTFTHVENEYLQGWVEWGLAGSVVWGGIFFMIGRQAWSTATRRKREWQMGGWAALAAMLVHSGMDFPLHIPANAWLCSVLLGMCLHDRNSACDNSTNVPQDGPRPNGFNLELILLGLLVLAGMVGLWCGSRQLFDKIEKQVARRDFNGAWKGSRVAIQRWPFYWRSYASAGASVAGLPSMSREVGRLFRTAQRLAQVNPEISWQAGALFLNRAPAVARDFFETAIVISEAPHVEMQRTLDLVALNGGDFLQVAPLGLRSPERWELVYRCMASHQADKAVLNQWLDEARERWLMDPTQRMKVLGPLVEAGRASEVMGSFKRSPPKRPREEYWHGRALESLGLFEPAVQVYAKLWRECVPNQPVFHSEFEVNGQVLRRAASRSNDMKFQRKVAEGLAAQSRHVEAAQFWALILAAEPNDPVGGYGYALGMQASGDWKKAASAWRRLVEQSLQVNR